MGQSYSQMCDFIVDRLLLRYLPLLSATRDNDGIVVITHLVADDGLPQPLDESRYDFGVLPLICKPSEGVLCQQFLGFCLDLSERATKES
jgi:hypothetical protein